VNLPNFLTVARILLTVVFLALIFKSGAGFKAAALVVFAAAALTDYLDGRIARKRGLVTAFGQLMDPIADKILVFGAFLAFVQLGVVPAWLVIVMLAREVLITGLRLLAANRGLVIPAQSSGKHKTILQLISILAILFLLIARDIPAWTSLVKPGFWAVHGLLYVVLAWTLYSGARFVAANRKVLG
jgi:CDP-diacylglycerol---glycerol-3-phosphate 3-phosphatidyltransferase